jgi:hypothetical protein
MQKLIPLPSRPPMLEKTSPKASNSFQGRRSADRPLSTFSSKIKHHAIYLTKSFIFLKDQCLRFEI